MRLTCWTNQKAASTWHHAWEIHARTGVFAYKSVTTRPTAHALTTTQVSTARLLIRPNHRCINRVEQPIKPNRIRLHLKAHKATVDNKQPDHLHILPTPHPTTRKTLKQQQPQPISTTRAHTSKVATQLPRFSTIRLTYQTAITHLIISHLSQHTTCHRKAIRAIHQVNRVTQLLKPHILVAMTPIQVRHQAPRVIQIIRHRVVLQVTQVHPYIQLSQVIRLKHIHKLLPNHTRRIRRL